MPLYNCIMTHIMKQQYPSPSNNINLERTSKGIMYTLNAICSRKNPAPLFFSDSYLLPQPIQRPTCNSQTNEKHKGLSQQYSALLLYIYIYIYCKAYKKANHRACGLVGLLRGNPQAIAQGSEPSFWSSQQALSI